jgi:polysaccharide biosynthesis/export protein
MKKRTTSWPRTGRNRVWWTALVVSFLAESVPLAAAQSVLKFVDSGSDSTTRVATLPLHSVLVAPVTPPAKSEYHFLELKEGKTPPLPQFSLTGPSESSQDASTLTFAPPKMEEKGPTSAPEPAACEMRFVLSPTVSAAAPAAPQAIGNLAATDQSITPDVAVSESTLPTEATNIPPATELFTNPPQTQPNASKPRIVSVFEHIPASVPHLAEARPVRTAGDDAPAFAPAGTELFTATAPKKWDLPALDYGSALRKVEPQPTLAIVPKPIAPTRVVARELPPAATEMFSFAPPEPLIVQSPVAPTPVASPQPVAVAEPVTPASPILAWQTTPEAVPAPMLPPAASPARTVAAPTFPAPAASAPAPTKTELFANSRRPLPAASELDFSQLPADAAPSKPQFIPAAPTYVASATPILPPAPPERLVPAAVSELTASKSPFAYESGTQPGATSVASSATVVAPGRNQVSVTTEPSDPNVYTFHFAANASPAPAMLANNTMPAPVMSNAEPAAMAPTTMGAPGGCNTGCCPYGCPYLPGQSGTRALCGVDCGRCGAPCCSTWNDAQCIPWALFGPGEYVGPARPAHVETYYLRVNDLLTLTFIESRKKSAEHYRIGVGDELQIEWLQGAGNAETPLDRKILVQPDGTVTLPLVGEVNASGKTVNEFRDEVVKLYGKYQRDPQITVTPLTVNVAVQDVLKAVTSKNASSGQTQDVRVTPEGTIQAAGIGSVFVQGLTLDELKSELEARYTETYGPGLAVSPQLTERATSYVFMGGEVRAPGRYTLEGPTTVMQAISMAGGWNNGGDLHQVVVFRRDENWCLKATKIDIRAPLYGKDPCPTNDVWLRENDLVVVPKSCILCATDLIELYFTRGVYAVFPINYVYDFSKNSAIVPVP